MELLRKESLAGLPPAAAARVLSHAYAAVVPITPLPYPPLPLAPGRAGTGIGLQALCCAHAGPCVRRRSTRHAAAVPAAATWVRLWGVLGPCEPCAVRLLSRVYAAMVLSTAAARPAAAAGTQVVRGSACRAVQALL